MFHPQFLHFNIGKAAISLMDKAPSSRHPRFFDFRDKAPTSPQKRFSRFIIWIRLQGHENRFFFISEIGVLWTSGRVFSISGLIGYDFS